MSRLILPLPSCLHFPPLVDSTPPVSGSKCLHECGVLRLPHYPLTPLSKWSRRVTSLPRIAFLCQEHAFAVQAPLDHAWRGVANLIFFSLFFFLPVHFFVVRFMQSKTPISLQCPSQVYCFLCPVLVCPSRGQSLFFPLLVRNHSPRRLYRLFSVLRLRQ